MPSLASVKQQHLAYLHNVQNILHQMKISMHLHKNVLTNVFQDFVCIHFTRKIRADYFAKPLNDSTGSFL